MLALRWSARENGLLAVFLLVCDMPAPASSRRNALLLLLLLLCCCCCCCYGCWPSGDVGLKVTRHDIKGWGLGGDFSELL